MKYYQVATVSAREREYHCLMTCFCSVSTLSFVAVGFFLKVFLKKIIMFKEFWNAYTQLSDECTAVYNKYV